MKSIMFKCPLCNRKLADHELLVVCDVRHATLKSWRRCPLCSVLAPLKQFTQVVTKEPAVMKTNKKTASGYVVRYSGERGDRDSVINVNLDLLTSQFDPDIRDAVLANRKIKITMEWEVPQPMTDKLRELYYSWNKTLPNPDTLLICPSRLHDLKSEMPDQFIPGDRGHDFVKLPFTLGVPPLMVIITRDSEMSLCYRGNANK